MRHAFALSSRVGIAAGTLLLWLSLPGPVSAQEGLASCVVPLPTGAVGWWPGEGDGRDAVGANDATLHGGLSFAPGVVGLAMSLDGVDDFALAPTATSLHLQNFTIDGWIRIAGPLPAAGANLAAFGQNGYQFVIAGGSMFPGDSERSLFLGKSGVAKTSGGPVVPDDGEWHHVAVTKHGTTVTFYIDGVGALPTTFTHSFTFSGAAGGDFAIGTNPIYASQSNPPSVYAFPGLVDELRVFDRALDSGEVGSAHDAGRACLPPPGDTTAPELFLPNVITAEADAPSGVAVTYVASAFDDVDGAVTPDCSPSSGAVFPVGSTFVECTATDSSGNEASGSFEVIVEYTPPSVADLTETVGGLPLPAGPRRALSATLRLADFALERGNVPVARLALRAFTLQVRALARSGRLDGAVAAALIADAQTVAAGL